MSVTVEKAVGLIISGVSPLPGERIPLRAAVGRVLAEDLRAAIDQPPFSRSPLDGYALRAADIAGASRKNPRRLAVVSKVYAGMEAKTPVLPGQAVRVMTGAMLPEGADCVIRQEDTDEGEGMVSVFATQGKDSNVVFAGEDFKRGSLLLASGTPLDAAALSVAAASGCPSLWVRRRVRAAVVSTGDELAEPGDPLPLGKIYDSNLIYHCARLAELGAEVPFAAAAGDELEKICRAVAKAAEHADIVITTGGVSVGQKDLVPAALEKLGAETVFHGVAMKPGMPTLFARLGETPVLALSGNPFAAAVALELLARPLIFALGQSPAAKTLRKSAVLESAFKKGSPQRRFIRGRYEDGKVALPEGHSNGQMRSMVGCNCLLDVPPGAGPLKAGDRVEVLTL